MGNILVNDNRNWTDGQHMWRRTDCKKTSWEKDTELKIRYQTYIQLKNKTKNKTKK
jgi:hypothetical protein